MQTAVSEQEVPIRWQNDAIASRLERVAELLEAQDANPYRVRAYRAGAATLRHLDRPAREILTAEGLEGLRRLPSIGISLARSIAQLITTGRIELLEQLCGEVDADRVLATVPGLGPKLAARIHDQLGIETLAELEDAAYDGRLNRVPGLGQRRVRAVRESLAGRLHHTYETAGPVQPFGTGQPSVAELLDVDRDYRRRAASNTLPKIAPRRLNPSHEAWLPVFHTVRGAAHYTALFSNTLRAHTYGATRDWVVIYRDDPGGDGRWTVITARDGSLKGRRIVCGREAECTRYYATHAALAEV